jgi:hypothetical protein
MSKHALKPKSTISCAINHRIGGKFPAITHPVWYVSRIFIVRRYVMERQGDEIHVDEVEASGGSREGVVRWVLAASLLLALIAMTLVWVIPALS